ncbi:MAG: DoxX family protein [Alphaproteobacteria bacterium]|nr:DoxX family protein [Alphaproteobacteria bacterium]
MFYADKTTLEIIGQLLIVTLFAGTFLINATTKVKMHADRMAAFGVPMPTVVLWIGFALQGVGSALVLVDWHTEIGVALLLVFTVVATAIFHRFWTIDDPMRRHMTLSFLFSNIAVCGGLLLLL